MFEMVTNRNFTLLPADLSQLYVGCYGDTAGDRDLPYEGHKRDVYNSVESCTGYCLRKGFKYAGLQVSISHAVSLVTPPPSSPIPTKREGLWTHGDANYASPCKVVAGV